MLNIIIDFTYFVIDKISLLIKIPYDGQILVTAKQRLNIQKLFVFRNNLTWNGTSNINPRSRVLILLSSAHPSGFCKFKQG